MYFGSTDLLFSFSQDLYVRENGPLEPLLIPMDIVVTGQCHWKRWQDLSAPLVKLPSLLNSPSLASEGFWRNYSETDSLESADSESL